MEANARDIPQAEQEAGREGAPGFSTALLAVGVMLSVTAMLAVLIYFLMVAIRPIEARDATSREKARPAAPAPYTPAPSQAPSK